MDTFEEHDLSVSNENTEEDWVTKKFGPVCPKCKKRHGVFVTPGENLPNSRNDCNE